MKPVSYTHLMGVITYKCPNCGGGLTFNAEKQKYKCEYCLSEFSQEELEEIETVSYTNLP